MTFKQCSYTSLANGLSLYIDLLWVCIDLHTFFPILSSQMYPVFNHIFNLQVSFNDQLMTQYDIILLFQVLHTIIVHKCTRKQIVCNLKWEEFICIILYGCMLYWYSDVKFT